MGVSLCEQETTINAYRDSDIATVYTSDTTVMTKIDNILKNPKNKDWKLVKVHKDQEGEVVGKTYETKKKLVLSFRVAVIERELTEEQHAELVERMKKMRELNRLREECEKNEIVEDNPPE